MLPFGAPPYSEIADTIVSVIGSPSVEQFSPGSCSSVPEYHFEFAPATAVCALSLADATAGSATVPETMASATSNRNARIGCDVTPQMRQNETQAPVDPKPPAPRAVCASASSSTISSSGTSITTSCAIRSPAAPWNVSERSVLSSRIWSSPR